MSCSAIRNSFTVYVHSPKGQVGAFLFIIGIILSCALYSYWGATSMGFLGMSIVGLILLDQGKKSAHTNKTTQVKSRKRPESKKIVKAEAIVEDKPKAASISVKEYEIPQEVKKFIEENIGVISRGQSNETITMIKPSSHIIFQVKGHSHYFKIDRYNLKDIYIRFEAKKKARSLVKQHGLDRTIVIPQAELFTVAGVDILGVESLPFLGNYSKDEFDQIQQEQYRKISDEQCSDLAEFIIIAEYADMNIGNIGKLAGNQFGVVDFDDLVARGHNSICRIVDGLFGQTKDLFSGLFGIVCEGENLRGNKCHRILTIILKAAHKHGKLESLEIELMRRLKFFEEHHESGGRGKPFRQAIISAKISEIKRECGWV